jgi:hypothetical protein
MTPEMIARSGSEEAHQTALFAWAALELKAGRYPELEWMHAIPNGGSRGDDAKSRAIHGGKMKAQGVKTGVSDISLPVKRGPYSGLYIELKKPGKNDGGSKDQKAFGEFVKREGFCFYICEGWEHARDVLLAYMNLQSWEWMTIR